MLGTSYKPGVVQWIDTDFKAVGIKMTTIQRGTYHTVRVVKEEEAKVDFVAGYLASVVQPQQEVVLDQARVHAGHALLQTLVQLRRIGIENL